MEAGSECVAEGEHRMRLVAAAARWAAAVVSAVRLTLAARVLAAGLRYRGLRRGQVHTRVSEVSARLRIMAFRTGAPAAAQR